MDFEELPGGGRLPNPEAVIALIERFGIHGLGGFDGCACAHFELLGISVDVSCRKSEHCVRVHSGCLGFNKSRLDDVARAVLRQLRDPEDYRVRFCNYRSDHVNGRWEEGKWCEEYACVYCAKPRVERDGYLCASCQMNEVARGSYPLSLSTMVVWPEAVGEAL